ncbi:MAG: DinB family protein [Chitinophagales bacterium]|nr:DinB family protein [Chitinophagales bacterium]
MIDVFLKEIGQEAHSTRKMLALVPNDKFSWKPHEKSMSIIQLSTHIAELPSWVTMALFTDELDFSKTPYTPEKIDNTSELLGYFEKNLASAKDNLSKANEEQLMPKWTMRDGEQIFAVLTKGELIRHSISQTIHHRAQLGVYLRLLNIPIPGTYGPSADEMGF